MPAPNGVDALSLRRERATDRPSPVEYRNDRYHAFGNFPNFAVSKDGKFAAAVRNDFETPPEIWSGPLGDWRQLTKNNKDLISLWGKAENLEWTKDGFHIQGWVIPPGHG